MIPDYSYLDEEARKLSIEYPRCEKFIADLAVEYKRKLKSGECFIGDTADAVREEFQNEVSRRCHRASRKPRGKPRKANNKRM
jgi:hypothetical protein